MRSLAIMGLLAVSTPLHLQEYKAADAWAGLKSGTWTGYRPECDHKCYKMGGDTCESYTKQCCASAEKCVLHSRGMRICE